MKHISVSEWPTASPDLSPIDNIWRILKRNVAQRRHRNIQQLQDYLRQELGKLSAATLSRLVSSMPCCGNRTEQTFLSLVVQGNTLASFIITICFVAS
ncbi:hypothetical protein AVEN_77884-1 [Araneus ventricosus]|uniref:Tc1-like transposase DDE domain-containing protein n=1 Tax=Araneus ventricosus TaxID=182803 RepID=A0A4Y2QZ97_ARAVE|nr:hypothetical protein AVEN_77884-1 [Araneus ventricosus]